MQASPIRIISAIPGAPHLKQILQEFSIGGRGIITAFKDSKLKSLQRLMPESSELELHPFGAVVGQFLALSGSRVLPIAQSGHVKAAVSEVCLEMPEDSPFFASSRFLGTHRRIGMALDELREWNIDAEALAKLVPETTGLLHEKLASLRWVEQEVAESLRKIARERIADRLGEPVDLPAESTEVGRLLVFVGSEISPIQLDWLLALAEGGLRTTLIVDHSPSSSELFRGCRKALEGVKAEPVAVGAENQLVANLFTSEDRAGSPLSVTLATAADPLAECELVLRMAINDIERGVRPDHVTIFARTGDSYIPLLESAALRFGLILSCTRRIPLLNNSFARLTLEVIEFCAGEDVRALGPLLRSTYLKLAEDHKKIIEDALKQAYRGGDNQWQLLEEWSKLNEPHFPWLLPLLGWRRANTSQPEPLTAWADRILDLGHQPWHEEALDSRSQTSVRDGYAQSAMQRTLAQYATVEKARGAKRYTLSQFARIARSIWEDSEVTNPSGIGAVQVVTNTAEIGETEALYVLGMLEGVFPRRRSEDPILSDDERAKISVLRGGLPLLDSHAKAFGEREEFYRLCAAPSRKLVLSYPQTDDDRDNVPAFYLTEVERAMNGQIDRINVERTALTPDEPTLKADVQLRLNLELERVKPLPNILEDPLAKLAVSRAGKSHITPQDLSEMLECPFRYLSKRNLDLEPNRSRSRWHNLYRLPSTTGLSTLPLRETAQKALEASLDSMIEHLLPEAPKHDLALIRNGGKRLVEEWLDREFRSREVWPRDTVTDSPSFEHGHLRSKLKSDDGFVFLEGTFPALSERNGYRILHLFKAAEPWRDNASREDDPWYRLKDKEAFELGLYLIALFGQGDRVGVEIDSATGARNLFLMPRPEQPFQNDPANGFRITIIDSDQRKEIFRETAANIQKSLKRIRDAVVEAEPGEQCRTCEYGEICRRSQEFGEEVVPFGAEAADFS
jgi:hypothetical protein